jgi:ferredoxin-NADP reductase
MAGPAWYTAELAAANLENQYARTLVLDVPNWPGHLPGQHVDVRLTADDGYQATRSYSIATPPDGGRIELTVQLMPDGEVSPYLVEDMPVGASLELLGPIGGWFVWRAADNSPVIAVAGGAGIVPIMAMLRAHRATGSAAPFRVVYSLRTPDLLYYGGELTGDPAVTLAFTRQAPSDQDRPVGRITSADISGHGIDPAHHPACFVCGPNPFVESITATLTSLGYQQSRIKTERFGPTG